LVTGRPGIGNAGPRVHGARSLAAGGNAGRFGMREGTDLPANVLALGFTKRK